MSKIQLYEAMQDERDKPKEAIKAIEAWDAKELRHKMLEDAQRIKYKHRSRMDNLDNRDRTDQWRLDVTIGALREHGRPCTRSQLAKLLDVTRDTAYTYVKIAILADMVVVEKMPGEKEHYYALVDGGDGQETLDL